MMLGHTSDLAYFEMSISPSISFVSVVRRFVASFYECLLSDLDLASRVALVTHELLENAVKYSIDGETTIRMEIATTTTPPTVRIRTRNRADPASTAILRRNIDEMNALADPMAFFQLLMKRGARSGAPGGLGLGRIAAEAEMTVSYTLVGELVEVCAETTAARSP